MKNKLNLIFIFMVLVGLIAFVSAGDPTWNESAYNVSHYFNEDTDFLYNFTANVTDITDLDYFSVLSVSWSENVLLTSHSDFSWLMWNDTGFSNSTTGVMKINSTFDNQTGNYTFNMLVQGKSGGKTNFFEFIINATNDFPNFTNIETEYNLTQNQAFVGYVNATDEEEHYHLSFNISFYPYNAATYNCSDGLADWSDRTNCSLLGITNVSNTSAMMSFTPTRNDVGVYYANITVTDFGENYACPHNYCDSATYEQNKTTYSSLIKFNVLGNLEVNISDCNNSIFQENQSSTCSVNITTKGITNQVNMSSLALLRNYAGTVPNSSWFYPENITNAANNVVTAYINITPQKTEIGNWTINFTVIDLTSGQNSTRQIFLYVNRTNNDVPDLVDISNQGDVSVFKNTVINLLVYDDDLLIPDKLEGYNENITFKVTVYNQSDLSQELSISNFNAEIIEMPVSGTNRTTAKIDFTPISSDIGNYTINITVNDSANTLDSDVFNLSIVSNNYPVWNQTSYEFNLTVNSTYATTESFYINLTDGYVNDSDTDDTLTFVNNSIAFPGFSLSSAGILNFTPWKLDVGNWTFTINASDPMGLTNSTTFTFNISNINSIPRIEAVAGLPPNASGDNIIGINVAEDNYTLINLWTRDDDFFITNKDYYNESLNVNLTIEGPNTNLFSFAMDPQYAPNPVLGNQSRHYAIFTPNKTDVGNYNITINVSDASNSSNTVVFNLTVLELQHSPVITTLVNQTSAVNRTLYYDIHSNDSEDGNDSQGNLIYRMDFIQGTNFTYGNESIFNTTSGVLNITFNDSQFGAYHINLSVNDSTGRRTYEDFWIFVYGALNITFPASGQNFSLQENVTSNLTFRANHSIEDNLTYEFYINNSLKYNLSYYGNSTNLTWEYTPNFTDETHGKVMNLTLKVYPTTSNLINKTWVNYTMNWNINITHANSPISFSGDISDRQKNYDQTITIDLTEYFSDIDNNDPNYNQTVNFTLTSNASSSNIEATLYSNWSLVLSAAFESASLELVTIDATDKNMSNLSQSLTNATSNSFLVEFTVPTVTPPTTTRSSTVTKIVSLEIIMPNPVSTVSGERITLQIVLRNSGQIDLTGINLTSIVVKDSVIRDDFTISLDKNYIASLKIGKRENITMTIDINTEELGTYEITLNAKVKSPRYNDNGKIYIEIKEGEKILEKLLFTEEFLQENPECIEIQEILDEAKEHFQNGDFVNTVIKINEAIDGCKNAISQQARLKRRQPEEDKLYRYLLIATIAAFALGIMYHSYKRIRLKRNVKGNVLTKPIEAIKPVVSQLSKNPVATSMIVGMVIGLFIISNKSMTGFVVSNSPEIGSGLGLIFIIALGLLIFLIRKKHAKDRLKGLINKKVYTSLGDYIGKVEEVVLKKNKIKSLRIRLKKTKKKEKLKVKGIVVDYKQVTDVGHIVIVKGDIKKKYLK